MPVPIAVATQKLNECMEAIAANMPELSERELHIIRVKAGIAYPEFQEPVLNWINSFCDEHQLDHDYQGKRGTLDHTITKSHRVMGYLADGDVEMQSRLKCQVASFPNIVTQFMTAKNQAA